MWNNFKLKLHTSDLKGGPEASLFQGPYDTDCTCFFIVNLWNDPALLSKFSGRRNVSPGHSIVLPFQMTSLHQRWTRCAFGFVYIQNYFVSSYTDKQMNCASVVEGQNQLLNDTECLVTCCQNSDYSFPFLTCEEPSVLLSANKRWLWLIIWQNFAMRITWHCYQGQRRCCRWTIGFQVRYSWWNSLWKSQWNANKTTYRHSFLSLISVTVHLAL
jgi:hypothetical protein